MKIRISLKKEIDWFPAFISWMGLGFITFMTGVFLTGPHGPVHWVLKMGLAWLAINAGVIVFFALKAIFNSVFEVKIDE